MGSRLNPYLTFAGNARDAMEYYHQVFGGDLSLTTFGQFGAADGEQAEQIMHGNLETDAGYTLMASDLPPGQSPRTGDSNITVSISGDDTEAMRGYWQALSEGGTVSMPLEVQMWGDEFGECTDKFGVAWMVNIAGEQNRPQA